MAPGRWPEVLWHVWPPEASFGVNRAHDVSLTTTAVLLLLEPPPLCCCSSSRHRCAAPPRAATAVLLLLETPLLCSSSSRHHCAAPPRAATTVLLLLETPLLCCSSSNRRLNPPSLDAPPGSTTGHGDCAPRLYSSRCLSLVFHCTDEPLYYRYYVDSELLPNYSTPFDNRPSTTAVPRLVTARSSLSPSRPLVHQPP
jgi:hypothetical protein